MPFVPPMAAPAECRTALGKQEAALAKV